MLNASLQLCGEVFVPSARPAQALLPTLQQFKETAAVRRAENVLLRQTRYSLHAGRASEVKQFCHQQKGLNMSLMHLNMIMLLEMH